MDTGSSISILNKKIFDLVKDNIKYKFLSRNVSISTVNSNVEFTACAEISFKINGKHFRHPFFLVYLPNNSKFSGILGYDFMVKNNVSIHTKNNSVIINNKEISLLDMNTPKQIYGKLARKLIVPPNSSVCAHVMLSKIPDCNTFMFIPNLSSKEIDSHPAVYTKQENEKNTLTENNLIIKVLIKNNSNVNKFHVNKNTIIGHIEEDLDFEENYEIPDNINNSPSAEQLNLIQASPDMLEKRKAELKASDFQLDHLNEKEKQKLLEILMSHYSAFSKSLKTLGCTDKIVPKLQFIHKNPIRTLPFPIPQALEKEALSQIEELQEAGLIERTVTEWSCPILFVKKKPVNKNDPPKYRMALDLRLLNSIIHFSSYPLPKISTIISNLAQYKFFTICDLKNAYWQIKLPEEYQNILAFTTPWGTFKNKRLVFGLKTSASNFQALMDSILDEIHIQGLYAYQDDVLICANSFEESLTKINALLDTLQKYNITLSPEKCSFHKTDINYLGFHIAHGIVRPIKTNIIKITSFPVPKTARQVKKFVGLCGFYRSLIPSYAELTKPLIDLTSEKRKFKWTSYHTEVFQQLQKIFFSSPFVKLPDWNKKFILNTDASKTAISGVLLQEHNEQLHPISYFSKALSKTEKNYPAIKLELLAIVKSVQAFKHYLYNRHFTILSDSLPLQHYKKVTSPANIVTRWLLELSEYTFTMKHVKGKLNVLADFLSRIPEELPNINIENDPNILNSNDVLPIVECDSDDQLPIEEENYADLISKEINAFNCNSNSSYPLSQNNEVVFVNHLKVSNSKSQDPLLEISNETFLQEQLNDENISKIYSSLNKNDKGKKNKQYEQYFIHPHSKLLMYISKNKNKAVHKIVVPKSLRSKVLSIAHLSHQGLEKTYYFVSKQYYWTGIYADTLNFVYSCEKCIKFKPYSTKKAPFGSNWIPSRPGQFISLDILGPLNNGQYVLTIIDHFSRHLELYPLTKITADAVTNHLFSYISTYGRPALILCDLGSQFTSEVFHSFNNSLGIKLIHTSSGRPQANGISERINTAIKSTLSALQEEGHSFINALRIHKNLYNGSIHSSTNFTPNELHYGRNLSLIFDTFQPDIEPIQLDKTQYLSQVLSSLNKIYKQAYNNLERKQLQQNLKQNTSAKVRNLKENSIVYLKSKDKFKPKFTGPYEVVKKCNSFNYLIKFTGDSYAKPFKVHVDRLRLAPHRKEYLKINSNFRNNPIQADNECRYYLRSRH